MAKHTIQKEKREEKQKRTPGKKQKNVFAVEWVSSVELHFAI
jgi:hypothetical protein